MTKSIVTLSIFLIINNNCPLYAINDAIAPEKETNHTSRVIIGEGARLIIDKKLSAKVWFDDVVLVKGGAMEDLKSEIDLTNLEEDNKAILVKESASIPTELTINKAFPNPFNPVVSISYGLPSNSDVNILIHDLNGRKISEYSQHNKTAGWHEFKWDALDNRGNSVGSGVYLLTIQAGEMLTKQKLTFIK